MSQSSNILYGGVAGKYELDENMEHIHLVKWLDRLSRWLLAGVFLAAGLPKLFDPYGFAEIIAAYGLLPEPLLLPVAVILPLIEVIAACGLLFNNLKGLIVITGLMVFFIVLLTYAISIGLDIDCGCFGPEEPEHKAFSGLRTALVRDILLCIPVAFSLWYKRKIYVTEINGGKK